MFGITRLFRLSEVEVAPEPPPSPPPPKPPATRKARNIRADIQGLRMVAVVAIILNHLLEWPRGGFIGVDVFFVISGFLITSLLVRQHERTGKVAFAAFYTARFRRIIPAATLVLVVTSVAGLLLFNQVRATSTYQDSIWAFLFSVNWHFAEAGTNYFQANGPISAVQHYWSLSVEQQLYLVWPVLMFLAFLFTGKVADPARFRRAVATLLIVVTVLSFAWSVYESAESPTVAYFSTFSRTWELGVGGIIAIFSASLAKIPAVTRTVLGWLGLIGVGVSLFAVTPSMPFPGPWAALPVVCTGVIVAAGIGGPQKYLWPLTNPVSGYIGNLSFSLYLWHFPVIVFVVALIGDGNGEKLLAAIIFLVLAIYSFHLLEDPVRKSQWLSPARPGRAKMPVYGTAQAFLAGSLALVVAAVATISLLNSWSSGRSDNDARPAASPTVSTSGKPTKPATSAETTAPPANTSKHPELDAVQAEIKAALTATTWPELSPSLDEVMAGNQAPDDVLWCGTHTVDESRCTWGDPNATHTIVTVGDSISMTYVGAIRAAIGDADGWNLVSYGMFGCPFKDRSDISGEVPDGCLDRTAEAVEAINRIKPDVIILSGIANGDGADTPLGEITTPAKVVFLNGPPRTVNPQSCYTKVSKPSACVDHELDNWAQTKAAAKKQGRIYLDSSGWFCNDDNCPMFVGTLPVRLDQYHMTAAYAVRLGPVIRESLRLKGIVKLPAV